MGVFRTGVLKEMTFEHCVEVKHGGIRDTHTLVGCGKERNKDRDGKEKGGAYEKCE